MKDKDLAILKNVNKVFLKGSVDEVKALDKINLNIDSGDFITVIGSNGAGKTTLLNIIAGVYPPEKDGKIIINGRDVTRSGEHNRARFVSRVYQNPHTGTAAKMTIEENLSLAMLRGQTRGLRMATNKKRREIFRTALAPLGLGLENRLNAMVGTLSGGQRQALALVMASISEPCLLLLDEHVAALDPQTNKIVLQLSEMVISKDKITTVMVTHNMEHALHYGNRLIMMHKGRIIVDFHQDRKSNLNVNDLVVAFERASGEKFTDDSIMLRNPEA